MNKTIWHKLSRLPYSSSVGGVSKSGLEHTGRAQADERPSVAKKMGQFPLQLRGLGDRDTSPSLSDEMAAAWNRVKSEHDCREIVNKDFSISDSVLLHIVAREAGETATIRPAFVSCSVKNSITKIPEGIPMGQSATLISRDGDLRHNTAEGNPLEQPTLDAQASSCRPNKQTKLSSLLAKTTAWFHSNFAGWWPVKGR